VTQDDFLRFAHPFADPLALVTRAGDVLAANDAAATLLGISRRPEPSPNVADLVESPPESVRELLARAAGTRAFAVGSLALGSGDAQATHRAEGALVRPAGNGSPALLLLRLSPRSAASGQFVLLNRQIESLNREIRERLRVEEALREESKRLEEANRAKDEFLAVVSHELRTPLNAIVGWLRLARSGSLDHAASARAFDTIERNVTSLGQLVEDLLDVSRVITGNLRLHVSPVDLGAIVESAAESLRVAAEAKEIRIEMALDPLARSTTGDPERLRQVVWNLISNAIKFTPNGGTVTARLRASGSSVELSVQDTGEGIDPAFIPHVFERFRQADASISRRHGGLGLGLSIVRHVVELHGGTVGAESDGLGRGATFVVRLPVHVQDVDDGGPARVPSNPFHGQSDGAELAGVRVLVVDDEPDSRDLLVVALSQYGAEVRAASSAAEALSTLDTWPAQVLVSDIAMPDATGYDLVRAVRALSNPIPAIALTAFARREDRIRALEAGFQMHVAKPVEPAELTLVIRGLLDFRNRSK
jgi:signal transduction histidine kinase